MWPFQSRLRAELEAVKADRERIRGERDQFGKDRDAFRYTAENAAHQLASADAANRRLHDRNVELGRRLARCAEADPDYAAALEQRVDRLKKVGARILTAYGSKSAEVTGLAARVDEGNTKVENLRKQLFAWEARARAVDPEQAWLSRPVDGAPAVRDESVEARVRREKDLNRDLAARLAEMTVANQKCTCQRPLAETGGVS